MTLGNMRAVSLCRFVSALAFACVPANAQSNRITCAGILIDVDMRTNAEWPLAVIYDADGHYTCTIDRTGSGHEPLKPCSAGEKCRVVGTFRKVGHTYSIRIIDSVDRAD